MYCLLISLFGHTLIAYYFVILTTMARVLLIAVVAMAASACFVAAQPTFPNNWSSDQTSGIAINQGGVKNPDGSICCPAESPECKVQTAFQAGIQYTWFDGNFSAFRGPDGNGIVTDFTAQKEYSVTGDGTCQAYCPLQGQTMQPGIGIGPNATSMGKVNYNGRMLNLYQSVQKVPIFNITMATINFYVDESGSSPVPVAIIQIIEPLGHQLGAQNQTFVTFTPGVPAKSHFLVKGAATCKMSKGCNQNGGDDDGGQNNDMMYFARRMAAEGTISAPDVNIKRRMGVVNEVSMDW